MCRHGVSVLAYGRFGEKQSKTCLVIALCKLQCECTAVQGGTRRKIKMCAMKKKRKTKKGSRFILGGLIWEKQGEKTKQILGHNNIVLQNPSYRVLLIKWDKKLGEHLSVFVRVYRHLEEFKKVQVCLSLSLSLQVDLCIVHVQGVALQYITTTISILYGSIKWGNPVNTQLEINNKCTDGHWSGFNSSSSIVENYFQKNHSIILWGQFQEVFICNYLLAM